MSNGSYNFSMHINSFFSQIEFIPILGEFASRLIEQIEKFENN